MIKPLDSKIRKSIIKKLIFNDKLSFSKLMESEIRSNKFNYHLMWLVKNNFVVKNQDNTYSLSDFGKQFSSYIDIKEMEHRRQPLVIVGVVLRKNKKILLSEITKEPFKGVFAISSVDEPIFGETLEESAARSVEKNTGYKIKNLKLKVVFSMRTCDNNIQYHHYFFIFSAEIVGGKLKEITEKRKNKWINEDKISKLNIFPDVPLILELTTKNQFAYREIIRERKDGKFTKFEVIK